MNRRNLLRKAALCSPAIVLPSCSNQLADLVLKRRFFIPTNQILAKMSPHFPFQRSYQSLGQLSLSNPVFSMVPDQNKVRLGLTTGLVTGSGLGQLAGIPALRELGSLAGLNTGGTCQLACGLRYDRNTRGIYLKDPVVEKLELNQLASNLTNPFRQVVNTFGPSLLDKYPIHTLDPSLASRLLQEMVVEPTGIALKFGA